MELKKKTYFALGLVLIVFFMVGFLIGKLSSDDEIENKDTEVRESGYTFISPLLDYQGPQQIKEGKVLSTARKIEDYIDSQKSAEDITYASVYMRELNNGPWFGINEKDDFSPASLLKVPVAIAILKKAEGDPSLLEKKIINKSIDDGAVQNIEPTSRLKEDGKYTVWELIEHMILYSDNKAKNLLLSSFNDDDLNRIYHDLGIGVPGSGQLEDFMSVKEYATFFRILYNASYLNKQTSNKLLELLSRIDYKQGIVAGIPRGTTISHKFGERGMGEIKQLHDCGIIYYPKNPILLCIMTRGGDFERLSNTIKTITQIVHKLVSN